MIEKSNNIEFNSFICKKKGNVVSLYASVKFIENTLENELLLFKTIYKPLTYKRIYIYSVNQPYNKIENVTGYIYPTGTCSLFGTINKGVYYMEFEYVYA